jgi:hexosaminidase
LAARSARLSDEQIRASQLGELGTTGLEALGYLEMHTAAPASWLDARRELLASAEKPSGLLRFVFLPDLRKLVEAAGAPSAQH